jgi:hypothetical protein
MPQKSHSDVVLFAFGVCGLIQAVYDIRILLTAQHFQFRILDMVVDFNLVTDICCQHLMNAESLRNINDHKSSHTDP